MKKMMLTAVGAAFLMFGASSSALADECDASMLPNQKNWTYESTETQTYGEPTTNNGSQTHVEVTTVTFCGAINNGGNLNDDHSYVIDSGTSYTVHVCNGNKASGSQLTNEGAQLGWTESMCNAL